MSEKAPVFRDERELGAWLSGHGIDPTRYGQHGGKPLGRLLGELRSGESVLVAEGDRVLRRLRVVSLRVTCGELLLAETRQVLADGRSWTRDFRGDSLAEKMLRHERVAEAAARALREELGLGDGDFRVLGERRTDIEERESPAYPGLRSRFVLHRIDAEVLPSGFRAEGYVERQPDKDTFFEWRPA